MGKIFVWEPPQRFVVSWDINSHWKPDTTVGSEAEVRFIADGQRRKTVLRKSICLDRQPFRQKLPYSIVTFILLVNSLGRSKPGCRNFNSLGHSSLRSVGSKIAYSWPM